MDRDASIALAAADVDVVLICTPDAAIASVAAQIEPGPAVVLHCSGATGLDVLGPHVRIGSMHPLMALPDRVTGAARLQADGWFAIDGDPDLGLAVTRQLVESLGGRAVQVDDDKRALYHATAVVSANHTVALLGQIERLAAQVGVPLQAFLDMAQASLDDVSARGAAAALTGPASRGDLATLDAHRHALPASERALYDALASAAATLAGRDD